MNQDAYPGGQKHTDPTNPDQDTDPGHCSQEEKSTVFLNIINWVSKSLATGTGTSTTFNVIESGSNSPETVLFRD